MPYITNILKGFFVLIPAVRFSVSYILTSLTFRYLVSKIVSTSNLCKPNDTSVPMGFPRHRCFEILLSLFFSQFPLAKTIFMEKY